MHGLCWMRFAAVVHAIVSSSASCDADQDQICAHDEVPLMQLGSRKNSWGWQNDWNPWNQKCFGYPVYQKSQCKSIVKHLNGSSTIGWWNMPPQPIKGLADKLTDFTDFPKDDSYLTSFLDKTRFSIVDPAQAARMMFNATKVKGLFENVPEPMRGVFWMRGNGMPEELTVFQYGRWFPEESIFVQAYAPFTWAHPAGKPKDAPFFGMMYSDDASKGAYDAAYTAIYPYSISYKWGKCPSYSSCYGRDTLGNMSFAYMQVHSDGRVADNVQLGALIPQNFPDLPKDVKPEGAFTMEAESTAPGKVWNRACKWGFDTPGCATIDGGSYPLTRILDGEGNEVTNGVGWWKRNYFQEFIKYMGDVKLILWTGFKSEQAKHELAAQH